MKIQILGTAAAEAWPGIFCGCGTCKKARAAGGKNLRSRSSIQIDDIYKIDFPPDTYHHIVQYELDLSRLKYLFFTHSHGDHLAPQELDYARPVFAHNMQNAPIRIYANSKVVRAIKNTCTSKEALLELHVAEPFIPIKADNLTFIPIIAEHSKTELCLNYIIQSDTATVLYASDTGKYGRETMSFLHNHKFDALIVECTFGAISPHRAESHMNLDAVVDLRDNLSRSGSLKPSARTIITHFSHNMGLLHDELEQLAEKHGIGVAYDGIVIEV